MSIDAAQFKHIMSRWCSGVTVVTMKSGDMVHGLTASAFCSVSLNPSLILVCVGKKQSSLPMIKDSGRFIVNILAQGQDEVSQAFAMPRPEGIAQFAKTPYKLSPNGTPVLEGTLGHLDCKVHSITDAGDHEVIIGEIERCEIPEAENPLLYYKGKYRQLSA
jgi:3-hydroxy-9,10-secoandrosta-1,3,5(10)-triene-9,17-dione monooxygenase reductase component